MIGRSWPAYVFIRIAILAIRLIAPLSIIYLAASYHANAFLWSPFLGVYAIVEAAFYLLVYLPRSFYLQQVRFRRRLLWTLTLTAMLGCKAPTTHVSCRARGALPQMCKHDDLTVDHRLVPPRSRAPDLA